MPIHALQRPPRSSGGDHFQQQMHQGIADPEQHCVIDGGVGELRRESSWRRIFQNAFMGFCDVHQNINNLLWLMVVSRPHIHTAASGGFLCGEGVRLLCEEILVGHQ